jgi:hypothetical protein
MSAQGMAIAASSWLDSRVASQIETVRGTPPTDREVESVLATVNVHPDISNEARDILRTGKDLATLLDNTFVLRRANGAERLAFYVISALANWDSFATRKQLKDEMVASERPYGDARIDQKSGTLILPPVDWGLLKLAIAEAEDCFATNMSTAVNPGKETMRAAGLKRSLWQSDIYKYASHPAVLKIVSDYFGLLPILLRINLLLSANDRLQENSSQFPHLDPEDFRQMKIFLYINDVDEETGPFQVLRADASDRVQNKYAYRFGRLTDAQLFAVAKPDDLIVCTGPSGTANFADTSRGFHFGSRPSPKQRKLVMYQYVTPFAASWPIAAESITGKYSEAAKGLVAKGHSLSRTDEYLLGVRR